MPATGDSERRRRVQRTTLPREMSIREPDPVPARPDPEVILPNPTPFSKLGFDAARRVVESVVAATVVSAALFIVGSVYTDAYYGRLSIEVTSLDLAPPFVALQAAHALQGLLAYPSTLLFFYLLYRIFAAPARRARGWFERTGQRYPRLLPVLANLAVLSPLIIPAIVTSATEQTLAPGSVLTEIAGVLGNAGLTLLAYAIWLGWSQRTLIWTRIRERRLAPIALVFIVYLLNALAATAPAAERAAELLMTGASDASLEVVFTLIPGAGSPLIGKELLLVTVRNGAYYAVERQAVPAAQRPRSYMIPAATVAVAEVRRVNDADPMFQTLAPGEAD